MTTRSPLVTLLVAAALAVAACGSDDDEPADDGTTTAATTDDTTTDDTTTDDTTAEPGGEAEGEESESAVATDGTTGSGNGDASSDSGAPRTGGTLRIGLGTELNGFDPMVASFQVPTDRIAGLAVHDPLIGGQPGLPEPVLASSLEPNDDLTIWTLGLDPGRTFSDGTPVDAAAVAANFDRFLDPEGGCPCAAEVAIIESVDVVDDTTVAFTLAAPSAGFPAVLASNAGFLLSPAAIEADADALNTAPVGAGAYIVDEFNPGTSYRLVPNENYGGPEGPYLDAVEMQVIGDESSRLAGIEGGDLDLAVIQDPLLLQDAADAGLDVEIASFTGSLAIIPNFTVAPFDDIRAREAIALAIDRETVANVVAGGFVAPADGPFDAGSPFYAPSGYPEPDTAAAAALVDELGGLSFTLKLVSSPTNVQLAEVVQQMLSDAGVDMTIEPLDQGTLISDAVAKNFEAALLPSPDNLDPDFGFTRRFASESPVNFGGWVNEDGDRLLGEARATADDETRIGLYQEFAELLNADLVYLWTIHNFSGIVSRPEVEGITETDPQSLGSFRLAPVWLDE